MLLLAIACFYWLWHAFTGYCMLLQAMACFYRRLHAFTGYCMLLQSVAGFCMLCRSCLYACFCIYLPDQTIVYTCIIDIQFCNVFILNNILRQYFFLEWTNFLEPRQFRQYMTIRKNAPCHKKKLNHLTHSYKTSKENFYDLFKTIRAHMKGNEMLFEIIGKKIWFVGVVSVLYG